jgi:diaminopimelate decarboxylase
MKEKPSGARKHSRSYTQSASPVSPRYARDRWDDFLSQDKRGMLLIEGKPVDEIAKKYGTPLYIMVESEIRRRCQRFKKVFGNNVPLQFAVKCNSNLEILKIVREEGFELDCSSIGEVILALLADFTPKQISFTNLYKSEQDIHFAAQLGIQSITTDSYEDIESIARTAKKLKRQIRTVIRVNPMFELGTYSTKGNKYGIPINYIDHALDLVQYSPYVDFRGFHFMGGYVYNPRVYKMAARILVKLIKKCYDRGLKPKTLSLGGGFPAAIGDEEAFPIEQMKDFNKFYAKLLEKYDLPHVQLIFEPGKSIVLNAGIGLMRVISKKRLGRNSRVVIADGSSYNFIPDALVQGVKYDILPANKLTRPRIHKLFVAGNTCDCWDIIVKDLGMPKLEAGDLLAAMDVGAYASVMASNFNTIKRASMILIAPDGTTKLIRRRERFSEMFAPELDVLKVAGPNELEDYNNLYRVNVDRIVKEQAKLKGFHKKYKNGNGNGNGKESIAQSMKKQWEK